jgi:hypothetical protein
MKPIANTFRNLMAVLLPMAIVGLSPLIAAPPVQTEAPKSVFVLPDSPREGRDPFFPSSIRPYRDRPTPGGAPELSDLKLEGISRSRGHVFAIINDETFGVGDDEDVKTSTGNKIHVLCVQIKADAVVIEAGGQTLTLTLSNP